VRLSIIITVSTFGAHGRSLWRKNAAKAAFGVWPQARCRRSANPAKRARNDWLLPSYEALTWARQTVRSRLGRPTASENACPSVRYSMVLRPYKKSQQLSTEQSTTLYPPRQQQEATAEAAAELFILPTPPIFAGPQRSPKSTIEWRRLLAACGLLSRVWRQKQSCYRSTCHERARPNRKIVRACLITAPTQPWRPVTGAAG